MRGLSEIFLSLFQRRRNAEIDEAARHVIETSFTDAGLTFEWVNVLKDAGCFAVPYNSLPTLRTACDAVAASDFSEGLTHVYVKRNVRHLHDSDLSRIWVYMVSRS